MAIGDLLQLLFMAPIPPCPFSVGEHVLCKLRHKSNEPSVIAEIVAIDSVYSTAARLFHDKSSYTRRQSYNSSGPPKSSHGHTINLTTPPLFSQSVDHSSNPCVLAENPISVGKIYIHFLKQDHRLDRWEPVTNVVRTATAPENTSDEPETPSCRLTRAMKRAHDVVAPHDTPNAFTQGTPLSSDTFKNSQKTIVRNVSELVFGQYCLDTWYYSKIHPTENQFDVLYICPTCLALEDTKLGYAFHLRDCNVLRPPGRLIYDDEKLDIRVYEIDAFVNQLYCMRFARLAKFFIEHKVACYDICSFLFYVVTLGDDIAGYFSKERPLVKSHFNLSCILTFPQHQRKGIGSFLIAFSYELSRREGKLGTPERPLSDLGRISYRRYWTLVILKWLRYNQPDGVRVPLQDISAATSITEDDIVSVLRDLNLYCVWKGEKFSNNSYKVIDSILAEIPPEKIPLQRKYFKSRWQNAVLPRAISPTLPIEQFSGSERHSTDEPLDPVKFKHSNAAERASKMPSLKTTPSIDGNALKNKKDPVPSAQQRLKWQEKKILQFVRKHTPDTVVEELGSRFGLSHRHLRDFAQSIGLGVSVCHKKILLVAMALTDVDPKLMDSGNLEPVDTQDVLHPQKSTLDIKTHVENCREEGISDSFIDSSRLSSDSSNNDLDDQPLPEKCCDQMDSEQNENDKEEDVEYNFSGIGCDDFSRQSPGELFSPEVADYDPYLQSDELGGRKQPPQTGDKRRVIFNEEVVVKGGIVVIDD